jgi:MFS family permease
MSTPINDDSTKRLAAMEAQTTIAEPPKHDVTDAETLVQDGDIEEQALPSGTLDPVYEAKARVLNQAIQQIGMGRYQRELFVVIGFGWASDNLWPVATSLILPAVKNEFGPTYPQFLTLAQNIGLLIGAVFWGLTCDVWGRRPAFNITIGITAVFGLVAGASPNFAAICTFAALWSVGVGGNLPVDSAIFLEFLPATHQYLLTMLSILWALAQLITTLIAWPLLGNFSCQQNRTCTKDENMGWRYYMYCMGGLAMIMFAIRFWAFTLFESPKYLMSRGRDEEAVSVVHEVARRNGKVSTLTLEDLTRLNALDPETQVASTSASAAVQRKLTQVDFAHIRALFSSPKLAISTSLITVIWAFIGLGFPLYNAFLPYIQATRGAEFGDGSTYITYRNSLIIATLGIPGCYIGAKLVQTRLGRKGVLSVSTALVGVFLFLSTTAKTSEALLGWNCGYNFFSNIMYAVLYAYTPEIFPTKDRGTGNAVTAAANRIFGIMAPIVAMFGNLLTSVPVYVSGSLFIAAGLVAILLPYEPRGKASL